MASGASWLVALLGHRSKMNRMHGVPARQKRLSVEYGSCPFEARVRVFETAGIYVGGHQLQRERRVGERRVLTGPEDAPGRGGNQYGGID